MAATRAREPATCSSADPACAPLTPVTILPACLSWQVEACGGFGSGEAQLHSPQVASAAD